MSKKKANKASIVFRFDGHDDMVVPLIKARLQEIIQLVELSKNGDIDSKERLKKIAEASVAWEFQEIQTIQNGFKNAELTRSERQPVWSAWQQEAERLFKVHPTWSKTKICELVAKNNGVARKTVSERVKNVGKPRRSRS